MLFDTFPSTSKFLDGRLIELTDIIRKVVFSDEVINLSDVYAEYRLSDGDTLESIARKVYGREDLSWVLMIFNRLTDPFYSKSLSTIPFNNFLNEKYDGQTLFLGASGSSFPFSVATSSSTAGISIGTLLLSKVGNSDGSISYQREPRGTIKYYDPRMGVIRLTNQTGKFKAGDVAVVLDNRVEVTSASVLKTVDYSREAPYGFGQGSTGASADLDPLGTTPDANGVQASIGTTNSTHSTSVTFGNTLLYDYITNNTQTYIVTNNEYEQNLNEQKRFIKVLDPVFIPQIELQMRELLRDA